MMLFCSTVNAAPQNKYAIAENVSALDEWQGVSLEAEFGGISLFNSSISFIQVRCIRAEDTIHSHRIMLRQISNRQTSLSKQQKSIDCNLLQALVHPHSEFTLFTLRHLII
ncbi:hypothetical protein D0T50_08270 [Bacteroides sp. 214]|nr:hypothetical protein [Bacteroides sp. 214]